MAFFKKPLVAALTSLLIVVLASYLSVNIKLGNECQTVTDGFYSGALSGGVQEESLYSHLDLISTLADDLALLASNYAVDTEALSNAGETMQLALAYSRDDISYIYDTYDDLVKELKALSNTLSSAGLSTQDSKDAAALMDKVSAAQEAIRASGYNESVLAYLRRYNRFPTYIMGELANVEAPKLFS